MISSQTALASRGLPLRVDEVHFESAPDYRSNYLRVDGREIFKTESVLEIEVVDGKATRDYVGVAVLFRLQVYAMIDPVRCYTEAMRRAATQATFERYEDITAIYEYRFSLMMRQLKGQFFREPQALFDRISDVWNQLTMQSEAFWQDNQAHQIDGGGFSHPRPSARQISHFRRHVYGKPSR
jgi:hypothetical protein